MKNKIYNLIIVDESGSMGCLREATLKAAVERFTQFATQHSELRFLVTRVGCGIAGHTVSEVAPLFNGCVSLDNVSLPADFWDALGLKMNVGN